MFDACRVVDMAENVVFESSLQHPTAFIKSFELPLREVVELVGIRPYKVRKHRFGYQGVLVVQAFYQSGNIVFGVEPKAVHACIQLDMNGKSRYSLFLGSLNESLQQAETVHFGFQIVVEHGFEGRHFGVHYHDVAAYSVAS